MTETLAHGTHLIVLGRNFSMNTDMTGFRWLSNIFFDIVPTTKVVSAAQKLTNVRQHFLVRVMGLLHFA